MNGRLVPLAGVCLSIILGVLAAMAAHEQSKTGHLKVLVTEASGRTTAVRGLLVTDQGQPVKPPAQAVAVMYGRNDRADGFDAQPDGAFYVDGEFELDLPPGDYRLTISKGYEFAVHEERIAVSAGADIHRKIALSRWIDMPGRGWYSTDGHIHIRRSPRENPLIAAWTAAEDVQIGVMLEMGDFWATYFSQYAWGKEGVYQNSDRMLTSGQEEPRTGEIGHTISMAADAFVRNPAAYYHYDQVFNRVHKNNGVSGYAHQALGFHGYRGMAMDVLRKKVDFLEVLQFCLPGNPLRTEHYYEFLDLGFKLTAVAGSDFPWCGREMTDKPIRPGIFKRNPQIGDARFYAYLGSEFTFENWRAALKAGHTFVSSGPIVDLKINGKIPGDTLDVRPGEKLSITAEAFGDGKRIALSDLEIVAHGKAIKAHRTGDAGASSGHLKIEMEMPAERGIWIAARCGAGPTYAAHTTPIYVTLNSGSFRNPETFAANLDACEKYLQELEREVAQPSDRADRNAWRYKQGLEERINETRKVIASLRSE